MIITNAIIMITATICLLWFSLSPPIFDTLMAVGSITCTICSPVRPDTWNRWVLKQGTRYSSIAAVLKSTCSSVTLSVLPKITHSTKESPDFFCTTTYCAPSVSTSSSGLLSDVTNSVSAASSYPSAAPYML